jgi:hypothetical protein
MKDNMLHRLSRLPSSINWVVGIIGCGGLGILYFTTRTEVHTFDALSYTWALEAKPFGLLFHPHHLLYGPLGWISYKTAQLMGYVGRADVPVQLVNAAAGALGIFFFWRFGARLTKRPLTSLGVSIVIGLCYSYWVYAAEVEVYTLATAFLTLALWTMSALINRPTARLALGLGLSHAGSILFHQTNLLFILPLAAFMFSSRGLRSKKILGAYALGSGIPVLIAYGYVAVASRFADVAGFIRWLSDYAQSGQWGGFLSAEHLPALRSGLSTAVSIRPLLANLFYLLAVVSIGLSLYRARKTKWVRPWLGMAAVWLFAYGLFFWWWEPWNIEFWIAILPMWGVWMVTASGTETVDRAPVPKPAHKLPSLVYTTIRLLPFLLAAGLAYAHWSPIREQGDADDDYYRHVADQLASQVRPDELVVTRGNVLDLYIPFYAGHSNVLSMRQLEQAQGGAVGGTVKELLARLDWATVTGQPFLIDQFILDEAREPIRNPFGLTPQEIESIVSHYDLEPVIYRGDQHFFYGSPRYDNIGQTAWRFRDSLQGWGAWGIGQPRFDREGWCFVGGIDPQLKGPIINIDGDIWSQLSLDISLDADVSYAQIFWRSPQSDYALENSVEVALRRGRHVYVTDLAGAPAWKDAVAQIRVDPIPGQADGEPSVTACVHEIMLLQARSSVEPGQ